MPSSRALRLVTTSAASGARPFGVAKASTFAIVTPAKDGVDGTKPDPSFAGVTIANVLAFATPNGRAPLAAEVVTSLNALLKGTKHATGAY